MLGFLQVDKLLIKGRVQEASLFLGIKDRKGWRRRRPRQHTRDACHLPGNRRPLHLYLCSSWPPFALYVMALPISLYLCVALGNIPQPRRGLDFGVRFWDRLGRVRPSRQVPPGLSSPAVTRAHDREGKTASRLACTSVSPKGSP